MKLLKLLVFCICFSACGGSSQNSDSDSKLRVIERDEDGKIILTYDDKVYRKYDVNGRMIEYYGNFKTVENNTNFRTIIEYNGDTTVVVRCYKFDDSNTACIIKNMDDCLTQVYYYRNGSPYWVRSWGPVKDSSGAIIGKEYYEDESTTENFFEFSLPEPLK